MHLIVQIQKLVAKHPVILGKLTLFLGEHSMLRIELGKYKLESEQTSVFA